MRHHLDIEFGQSILQIKIEFSFIPGSRAYYNRGGSWDPGDPPEAMHPNCRCKTVTVDLNEAAVPTQKVDEYFRDQKPEVLAASFGKAPARAFLEGEINGKGLLNSGFQLSPEAFARLRPTMETL